MSAGLTKFGAAIMQPTYLPWAGYFNLIAHSHHFVFLDEVKFEKSSWHTRNRIPFGGQETTLTVHTLGSRDQPLHQVAINDRVSWRKKHQRALEFAYAHSPFGKLALDAVIPHITDHSLSHLAQLNIAIIRHLSDLLGLETEFHRSSQMQAQGSRSGRLLSLLQQLGTQSYFSPAE